MDIRKLSRYVNSSVRGACLLLIMHSTDQKKKNMMTVFCCCLHCFKYINFLMEMTIVATIEHYCIFSSYIYLLFIWLHWALAAAWSCSSISQWHAASVAVVHRLSCPPGTWDLSSLTRVWTCAPCLARRTLKPLDHQEVPLLFLVSDKMFTRTARGCGKFRD